MIVILLHRMFADEVSNVNLTTVSTFLCEADATTVLGYNAEISLTLIVFHEQTVAKATRLPRLTRCGYTRSRLHPIIKDRGFHVPLTRPLTLRVDITEQNAVAMTRSPYSPQHKTQL